MDNINIRRVNSSFLQLECDSSAIAELDEKFTFFVPGYRFMPKFKNKFWDGKLHLINRGTGIFPYGLLRDVMKQTQNLGYSVTIDKDINDDMSVGNNIDIEEFIGTLNIPYDLRSFQLDAIIDMWKRKRMISICPTGSGKSLIIYVFCRIYQKMISEDQGKILIVVPSINLTKQMESDFGDYSIDDEWDASSNVQLMGEGATREISKNIVISTWQSISNLSPEWYDSFDVVLADEVHMFKSNETKKISEHARFALWKLGTTGTLDGTLTHEMQLSSLFGPPRKYISTTTLIEQGVLSKLKIYPILFQYSKELIDADLLGREYKDEIEFIENSQEREKVLLDLCINLKGNTLIMFSRVVKMANPFYHELKKRLSGTGRNVYLVIGNVGGEERERIRKIMADETDAIIVSNPQLMSTGVNIRNLQNLIIGTPTKSRIKLLQAIGRILRTTEECNTARAFDIVDSFADGIKRKSFTMKHFESRLEQYEAEGFEYEIKKLTIRKTRA